MGHQRIWWSGAAGLWAVLALLAALALPRAALAGGVSVTVDRQPADVEAGKPFTVGFMVRSAHEGREPIAGLEPGVIASNPATNERVAETARPDGEAGHYLATLTLPSAGEWRWQIQPFGLDQQDMATTQPPLQVRAAGASAAPAANMKAAGTTTEVGAGDSFFKPQELAITAGTTVKWTNTGKLPHTVTAADGKFASGNLEPGASFSYTFAEPGTYKYYCEYHAARPEASVGGIVPIGRRSGGGGHMVGTVTVTAAAKQADAAPAEVQAQDAAPAQADNQLANIPAGQPAAQPQNALGSQQAGQPSAGAAGQTTMPTTGGREVPAITATVLALILVAFGLVLRRRRRASAK